MSTKNLWDPGDLESDMERPNRPIYVHKKRYKKKYKITRNKKRKRYIYIKE